MAAFSRVSGSRVGLLALILGVASCYRFEDSPPAEDSSPAREPVEEPTPAPLPPPPAPEVAPALAYQTPPPEVVEIVDAPPTPAVSMAADGAFMMLAHRPALPGVAVLAEPWLGLAGERLNPRTNERRRTRFYDRLELVEVAGAGEVEARTRAVAGLPEGAQLSSPDWAPNGRRVAFTHTSEDQLELWLVDDVDQPQPRARKLTAGAVNGSFSDGFRWLSGSEALVVNLVPEERGPAPVAPAVAEGPIVRETSGRAATNRTYQDLLDSPLDDALFEHYFTSELAIVARDGALTRLDPAGQGRGLFSRVDPSPDGKWLLVERLLPPFSHSVPWYRFKHRVELWSLEDRGAPPVVLVELPAAEEVPIQGVPTGPRGVRWQAKADATLVWVEALDGGDPDQEAEHRDRLLRLAAPFVGKQAEDGEEFTRLNHRYAGLDWLELPGQYLISEYDRDRKWVSTHLRDLDAPEAELLFVDRSVHDIYADPGDPVKRNLADDTWVVRVDRSGEQPAVFMAGRGATPEGDRPFLDRRPLLAQDELEPEGGAERLFESPADSYAHFLGFVGEGEQPDEIVVRRESPEQPPNFFRETLAGEGRVALSDLPHPHPDAVAGDKRLLVYERKDKVPLSATLYLPPGYDPESGEKLPLVLWAYPREYVDADTAGQVRAAPTRFTRLSGTSPTLFLTQGYAVMVAAMPVVGDPETMNDTLIEQLVASARAAIAAAEAEGVVDPKRVGIAGHSYGAFMVANLLAHSDLFRAGLARSGAYNRSLTPFGFQSERRTLWEAPEAYTRVSPLFAADTLDEPILMIHGEIDDNSGTFPIQSKRLFHALQGLGGTARLVILPHESHGYRARESVLHVLHESFTWFDEHVKRAGEAEVEADGGE